MSGSFYDSFKPSRMWRPSEIADDARRAFGLLFNGRVPAALKLLLPLGALIYWLIPVDLMPILPIDDIAVVLLAMRLFVTLGERATGLSAGDEAAEFGGAGQTVDTTWRVVDESNTTSG